MSDLFEEGVDPTEYQPPDLELPTPEQQLRGVEEDLAPYPDEVDLVINPRRPPIGRGFAFDPNLKGFLLGPQEQGVLQTQGLDTLKTWVVKCMHTKRGVHPIYSKGFGMQDPFSLIGGPLSEAAVGEYEGMLQEALTFHPRIVRIDDYMAEEIDGGEGIQVAFTVVLDDGSQIDVQDVLPV